MRHSPPPIPTTPLLLQRRTVIVACAVVVAITIIALAGGAIGQIFLGLLTDGLFLLAWLAAATGIGGMFFRLPRRVPPLASGETKPATSGGMRVFASRIGLPEFGAIEIPSAIHYGPRPLLHDAVGLGPLKFVTAVALGIGVLGLATFLFGLLGWLNRPVAFLMIVVGIALGALKLWRADAARESVTAWLTGRTPWSWLWLAAAPIVGIVIVAAFVPPGLLWGDEPNAYDVLSYHLQIPREWYEAGNIHRLDHNAFSYFPQMIESQFLLAMHLRGGPWAGMYLAQLMHAAVTLLSGAAVYGAAAAVASRPRAIVAGVAAICVPWVALLAPVAYNEGGLLFFGALAIGWTLHAVMVEDLYRDALLAGVMAGFACGVKLTAGPLLLVGLPLALLAGGVAIRPMLKVGIAAAMIFIVGLIVFAPWALRTYAWSGGNPVFPEANAVFKSDRFTDAQNQRWKEAHAPLPTQKWVGPRLRAAKDQIFTDWRYGFLFLPVAIIAMLVGRGRPEMWMLGALALLTSVFWIAFTHLQGRFFVLAIPVGALMLSQLDRRWHVAIAASLVVLQALLSIGMTIAKFESLPAIAVLRNSDAFRLERLDILLPEDAHEVIAKQAPLDMVGDARAFFYNTPGVRYRTVFDVKEGTPGQTLVEIWLGGPARSDAYLLVNPPEIRRLFRTYRRLPIPPADFPGEDAAPFVMPPQQPAAAPHSPAPATRA
jgi:hypothetical protein